MRSVPKHVQLDILRAVHIKFWTFDITIQVTRLSVHCTLLVDQNVAMWRQYVEAYIQSHPCSGCPVMRFLHSFQQPHQVAEAQTNCFSIVGLISPNQDLCIAQGHNVHLNPAHHICVTQQVNRDYLTKLKCKSLRLRPNSMSTALRLLVQSAVCVKVKVKRQGKGRANSCNFL